MSDAPRPPASTGWRLGEPARRGPVGPGRGTRRFIALVTLLAAAGAVVGALLWIRPAEPLVVLGGLMLCVCADSEPVVPVAVVWV